jgi:hypothetical protein
MSQLTMISLTCGILSLQEGLHSDKGLEVGNCSLEKAWSHAAHAYHTL